MADFNLAFDKVIISEGGYANDPDDNGGETYLGISRKANPYWDGWKVIDEVKKLYGTKNITNRLKANNKLTESAKSLYKKRYWDVMDLDDVPSQRIAYQLFDTGVNCGVSRAITLAQQVIGMTITGKWSEELRYNLIHYGDY